MRYFRIICAVMLVLCFMVSCKTKKEMTLDDYSRIEAELNLPDPELNKDLVEKVADKYGYTYDQYKEMFDKVQKDPSLKEKLGEKRLEEHMSDKM